LSWVVTLPAGAGAALQPAEQREQRGARREPGGQQPQHREAVPEHAQHRRRVFLQVLVLALMEN
ncbi:hypothetical protein, partial [Pseudomonas aeruginosa]|uniref:hypothetical protein n=1 Tax=Pseudomonas aeruginosa TaxID=287 RepID=UPI0015C5B1D3